MKFALFYHSLYSDWNHGNAHFLRGVVAELQHRGHDVRVYEPHQGWSLQNLLSAHGEESIAEFRRIYPGLESRFYELESLDLDVELDDVDVAIVHEWSEPELVSRIGEHHRRHGGYTLLFHDTHHRSVTAPEQMSRYDLQEYDGVLAFGEIIREIYLDRSWADRVWTWHEAADPHVFRPLPAIGKLRDLIWIGNWGDDERSTELMQYLVEPVRQLNLKARIHGVRYPESAQQALAEAGIEYAGWLPNFHAPQAFAASQLTVHIPRRPYRELLHGVPTIRVFEALACGIPLVCLNWKDTEALFQPGHDYLVVDTPGQMIDAMQAVLTEPVLAAELAANGLQTVLDRHTCQHRVDALLEIIGECRSESGSAASTAEAVSTRSAARAGTWVPASAFRMVKTPPAQPETTE